MAKEQMSEWQSEYGDGGHQHSEQNIVIKLTARYSGYQR
jgi:hypothetical protein